MQKDSSIPSWQCRQQSLIPGGTGSSEGTKKEDRLKCGKMFILIAYFLFPSQCCTDHSALSLATCGLPRSPLSMPWACAPVAEPTLAQADKQLHAAVRGRHTNGCTQWTVSPCCGDIPCWRAVGSRGTTGLHFTMGWWPPEQVPYSCLYPSSFGSSLSVLMPLSILCSRLPLISCCVSSREERTTQRGRWDTGKEAVQV